LVETLVVTRIEPETVAPATGAPIEIVGALEEDEFPFLTSALVRPTHPTQDNNKMKIRQQQKRLTGHVFLCPADIVFSEFMRVTRPKRSF